MHGAALHYAILVVLVQLFRAPPVAVDAVRLLRGGLVSYLLNRRHTFGSERPHEEAAWRFALVAGVAFVMTWLLMRQMVDLWHAPYLPAQVVTTGIGHGLDLRREPAVDVSGRGVRRATRHSRRDAFS